MALSDKEQQQINTLVGRFEADTGIQAVAAVLDTSDAYPEIPWKGYAIGSALGALAVVFHPFSVAHSGAVSSLALHALAILGAGAAFAAASIFVPAAARLLLDRLRAEGEVRQRALSMFLEREIFRTSARRAVLLLVSRFERVAVVLPDTGLVRHAPQADLERVAAAMCTTLARDGVAAAFEAGFAALRAVLQANGFAATPPATNEIDDAVVLEKDP